MGPMQEMLALLNRGRMETYQMDVFLTFSNPNSATAANMSIPEPINRITMGGDMKLISAPTVAPEANVTPTRAVLREPKILPIFS